MNRSMKGRGNTVVKPPPQDKMVRTERAKESEGFEGQSRQMSQKVLGCQVCDDFS